MNAHPTRDQLRALANAATPGPWTWHHQEHKSTIYPTFLEGRTEDDWVLSLDDAFTPSRATLEFIAAARTAVPQLLDQLDAAEQRIRDLTQEVRDERGAALDQMEQVRIRDARIKAVEDVIDTCEEESANTPHRYPTPHGDGLGPVLVDAGDIRRALDG